MKPLASWINNVYNVINTKIKNISDGATQLTVPTDKKIDASDINTILTKLDALKSDKYLSTAKSTLFTTYTQVSKGAPISPTIRTELDKITTNFAKAVCKNTYKNSHTTNSHGTTTTGNNKTSSCNGNGSNTQRQSSRTNQHVGNNNSYSNGDQSTTTNSHTLCSHGSGIDILNVDTTKP